MPSKHNLPPIMTVKEVAEYLRVHPSSVYKLVRRGELPAFRVGSEWRFKPDEIEKWARAQAGATSCARTRPREAEFIRRR
jgi:excisionase family DNA binding protein